VHRPWRYAAVALIAAATATIGCGGGGEQSAAEKETSHLRTLVSFYQYAAKSSRGATANEQAFREFLADKVDTLAESGVNSVDELFISERDNQPFVVIYGKRPSGMEPGVVAYEQTGVDGKRQVGFDIGRIEEADQARFNELTSAGAE